jgi:hypothetical protein
VKTTIIRMPANFPPSGTAHRELSGMGTPDLAGTYGTFTYYSSELFAFGGRPLSGGRLQRVHVREHTVRSTLRGPDNPFLAEPSPLEAEFVAYLDPRAPAIKLVVGDEERVLQAGEWSDWVPVAFPMIPTQTLRGMARFYLKQVRPEFELYVTPLNIDPFDPALPISTPSSYAAELARATGRFYTQGMPEDTKALEEGVLTRDEFLAQARLAGVEVRRQLHHALDTFDGGLLFYYVGNVDQVSHMLWGAMDPEHPAHDPERDAPYRDVIRDLYVELDEMVGETMARLGPDATLIVMSDHGFASWRRAFHLNSWLRDEGYLALAIRTGWTIRGISATSTGRARARTGWGSTACTSTCRAARRTASWRTRTRSAARGDPRPAARDGRSETGRAGDYEGLSGRRDVHRSRPSRPHAGPADRIRARNAVLE